MRQAAATHAPVALTDAETMRSFPKVELHRHLEGTFALPTLHRIARRNGLAVPADFSEFCALVQFPADSEPDFLRFLSLFRNDWYRSLEDVAQIVHDSVTEMRNDGLYYIELRFSPEHFALHNGFDRVETTRLVIAAADKAADAAGIEIRYLITFNRAKQNQDEMTALYRAIRDIGHPRIVGVDLAGDEVSFPPERFVDFFRAVNTDGVFRSTVHAGEVSPASQIWSAVRDLGASRIGHGVACVSDPDLQHFLSENDVVLEQCITSNYQTGSWKDERHHPIGALYRSGVPVTINSDDPTIQNASLTDDYLKAVRFFDFTMDDLVALNERAINASFLTDSERSSLLAGYRDAVRSFRLIHSL